jgi:hypothetical protein
MMVSGSNPRRIEPLRKHTQLRAIEGLARSREDVLVCRTCSSLCQECCGGSITKAGVISASHRRRRWLSYLPSVGKVIWCYRRTIGLSLSKEIGREETEEDRWGGTAVVL